MKKFAFVGVAVAAMLPLAVLPAQAVSSTSARQICVEAAAKAHSALQGNVQVRRVARHGSGYEVNLQVKGAEINCMVTGGGKVRYMN